MPDKKPRRRTLSTFIQEGSPETETPRERAPKTRTTLMKVVRLQEDATAPRPQTGRLPLVTASAEGVDSAQAESNTPMRDETVPTVSRAQLTEKIRQRIAALTSASGDSQRVLLVEDNEDLAEVIQATLENIGLAVQWLSHGSKVAATLDALKPHVLLLDIALPDISGWKILEDLRERQKANPALTLPAVIIITAYGDPANRLVGKLQGISGYLIKPFTPQEIESAVFRVLTGTAP